MVRSQMNNKSVAPVATVQDNKIIFKAIDLLTAAAATAQLANSDTSFVLANNTHILNNSPTAIPSTSTLSVSQSPILLQTPSSGVFLISPSAAKPADRTYGVVSQQACHSPGLVLVQSSDANNSNVSGPIMLLNSLHLPELSFNQVSPAKIALLPQLNTLLIDNPVIFLSHLQSPLKHYSTRLNSRP